MRDRPTRCDKMNIKGLLSHWIMKSGWHTSDDHWRMVRVDENWDKEVLLPKSLALSFHRISRTLMERSLVVRCQEGLRFEDFGREQWTRFKKELWPAVVKRYKDGTYGDWDLVLDGFEAVLPRREGRGDPKGWEAESVDMSSFRI